MSNPTVGTLRTTNGHEIARCSPAFIWSDDSRYLAVPQWIRRFGLFLRQRLLIVDIRDDRILASRFTYWLMDPKRFVNDQLELAVSSALGISWMKSERVVVDIPTELKKFAVLSQLVGRGPVDRAVRPLTTMNASDVSQLVNALCDGDENAFHTLLEADKSILPVLIRQFTDHANGADRSRIIEVIWQHRDKATIPFLASALNDPHSDVWKQALDGLVTIGGIESHNALVSFCSDIAVDNERRMWAEEAIGQIQT